MNNKMLLLAIVAVGLFAASQFLTGDDSTKPTGLPGARPAIDASNYPTLQAALDALPPEGGLVQLPAGEFEISEPLVLSTEDVCIEGHGTSTHIKNVNEEGKPALLIKHVEIEKDTKKNRLWRIRLANFRITGNENSGHGIEAHYINEIFIDGVTVSYHGGDGILLDHCYEDPRVCDSLITYNKGTGLNLPGCHDIVVSSNQFEENQDALHCTDAFNLCMTGNCLDDHLGHGVLIENTYGSVLSGNMIEECNGTAVILDRDCYGITISANVIAHNGGGVNLKDAHGCAVSANTFTIMKTDALRIGSNSGRITVTGNSFSSSYIGEGEDKRRPNDRAVAGLVLEGTSQIGISGNVFSGTTTKAVTLEGKPTGHVVFTSNLIEDCVSDHGKVVDSIIANNQHHAE